MTNELSRAAFEALLEDFLSALQGWQDKYYAETYKTLSAPRFSVERGQKYIRVVSDNNTQRSVYCFLDFQGNIYKAEGWKKPAKHVRGSLFDENFSLGKGLSTYGARYL